MPVVISCQARDEVRIGDSVGIVVLEVADTHVRLGISSPDQIPEYQEQVIYLADGLDEDADEPAEFERQLVGI